MDRYSFGKFSLMLVAALLLSSCGRTPAASVTGKDKIAVINWQQAMSSHPDYKRLQQGEKILKDLQEKRRSQMDLAKAQLGSLEKLRNLRRLSEESYQRADVATHMVEIRERENKQLQHFVAQVEAQVDEQLAPRTKAIEDSYQLEIFNLRTLLETVKMRPSERKAVEDKLKDKQHERGREVAALQAKKNALMEAQLAPYREAMQQRMAQAAAEYQKQLLEKQQGKDKREQELLSAAPKALHNAVSIMDREIVKQQENNSQLQKKIDSDISSQAVKLAYEKGYTLILKKYKVNIKADDITDTIIKNLPK